MSTAGAIGWIIFALTLGITVLAILYFLASGWLVFLIVMAGINWLMKWQKPSGRRRR